MNKRMKFKPLILKHGDKAEPTKKKIALLGYKECNKLADMNYDQLVQALDYYIQNNPDLNKNSSYEDALKLSLASACYFAHRSNRPILNIYITKKMEEFIMSSFSKLDYSELNHDPLLDMLRSASTISGNKLHIAKYIFEEGCKSPTVMFSLLKIKDGREALGLYGLWEEDIGNDKMWNKFATCLGLFLSETEGKLVDVDLSTVDLKKYKGQRMTIRAPKEVEEDIENSKCPHFRRGHYRMLQSDRFKKKGLVFVKGCFVKGRAKQIEGDSVTV